ncbi:hypothetical protein FHT76_005285 [Rhizobium sp. BK176]|nr:hypothetical protein [Rhizobium sp. BK399]MCS3741686.1 hypothetical protein [Rhizobium sp. BK661]MCS4093591.1 hypothetical protein [Rhizobium sp. BK176]
MGVVHVEIYCQGFLKRANVLASVSVDHNPSTFVGQARADKKGRVALNWHGPAPLILHFHLDLAWEGEGNDFSPYQLDRLRLTHYSAPAVL